MVSKATLAIDWPVYRPRDWGKPAQSKPLARPWYGLDTERDAKHGDFVTGWAVGEDRFHFNSLTDLRDGTYWVWNLAYDIEGLLRDLDIEEAWAAKVDGALFPLLDGSATYYHGKRFDWRSKARKISLIEASSFWGRQPLAKVAHKQDFDASTMSFERYKTEPAYRETVDSYCANDALQVYQKVVGLDADLQRLGIHMGATPGATARRFMARLGPFPRVIWNTHKAFLRSYCGGRFEITKRGVLHNLKQYDIVSAYPWALAECPWLTDTAYSRQTRRVSDAALYGSYEVSFEYDGYLGIAPRWRNGVRVYSRAQDNTWLTKPEVDWLQAHGVEHHILRGVEIFDPNSTDLWRQVITELFALKQAGKKELHGGWGPKIILNSEYGILIQLVRRTGEWVPITEALNPVDWAGKLALEEAPKEMEAGRCYAPVYAGHLTALTRIRLLDAALAVGDSAYAGGHTDSILTLKPLQLNIGEGLGDWELKDDVARADLCKTGMYALGDSVRIRGITRNGKASDLWEETHTRKARIGIKSAMEWRDVSLIVPKIVANNYSTEQKRKWHGDVTRGLIAMERFVDSEALAYV